YSDFTIHLPRIDGVIDANGDFVFHQGAELLIDKRPTTRIAGYQLASKMDYRTNKVRLEPGEMHTDYFDLGAFFPDAVASARWSAVNVPLDFNPILTFHDNFGNIFYADS